MNRRWSQRSHLNIGIDWSVMVPGMIFITGVIDHVILSPSFLGANTRAEEPKNSDEGNQDDGRNDTYPDPSRLRERHRACR